MRTPTHHLTRPLAGRSRRVLAAALAGVLSLGVAAIVLPNGEDAATASTTSASRRVDLGTPKFSHPTNITNRLFPASILDQAVQLGAEGDVTLRHEITLLDETRVVRWNGRDIETVVSQFVAYGDGEILEVATDFYAQADDGSVWYLGEDVTNYDNGRVENHDGTWLAGRDGPAGMIMPANPKVGDVYRPENIPGFVFEEVTVKRTNMTVAGPTGPVRGAIQVQERLMDGTLEDKIFAPGYGEFQASVPSSDELVTVAVTVPTDQLDGAAPQALDRLSDTGQLLFEQSRTGSWTRLSTLARDVHRSWNSVTRPVPPLLAEQMDGVLDELDAAVRTRSRADVRQTTLDLELATLDIEMQYDEPEQIDRDRVEVWRLQRQLHQEARDPAGAASDRVIIAAIQDRI